MIPIMSTKQSTIDYLLDQLASVPDVRARKMFGEYALYCNGRVVALVCDNELFVKITDAARNSSATSIGRALRIREPNLRCGSIWIWPRIVNGFAS